ncbi:hypothetical protein DEO72_LG1g2042 [Vigna unguiculata]|uniref:Uncharacterized protein n=1 Tax=Vigna unguiculata TaxID=3917 RepID=A0A4D6KTB6_VIGUN|nr:hypothetical protein DEO72_LG1g2042 [Vigna unguiculata]
MVGRCITACRRRWNGRSQPAFHFWPFSKTNTKYERKRKLTWEEERSNHSEKRREDTISQRAREQQRATGRGYTISHFRTDNKKEESTLGSSGSSERNHLKGRTRTGEPPLITPYQHRETTRERVFTRLLTCHHLCLPPAQKSEPRSFFTINIHHPLPLLQPHFCDSTSHQTEIRNSTKDPVLIFPDHRLPIETEKREDRRRRCRRRVGALTTAALVSLTNIIAVGLCSTSQIRGEDAPPVRISGADVSLDGGGEAVRREAIATGWQRMNARSFDREEILAQKGKWAP